MSNMNPTVRIEIEVPTVNGKDRFKRSYVLWKSDLPEMKRRLRELGKWIDRDIEAEE